jgi:hypothetical protein
LIYGGYDNEQNLTLGKTKTGVQTKFAAISPIFAISRAKDFLFYLP